MQRFLGRVAAGAVATILTATTMATVTAAAAIVVHHAPVDGSSRGTVALADFAVPGSRSGGALLAPLSPGAKPSHGPHGSQSPTPSPTPAPSPAPSPSGTPYAGTGYDVSWPNCGASLPTGGAFWIVGVTDGRAFTQNPCLSSEYQWAMADTAGMLPSFYLNLNAPVGSTARGNTSTPKSCSGGDKLCQSYNYGWNAAQAAYTAAEAALGGVQGATLQTYWWLDVETGNSWSSNTAANAQVVQGALDFLAGTYGTDALHVGVYSAPGMWSSIVGSNPVSESVGGTQETVPEWLATANATPSCPTTTFTGGPVWLVQYSGGSGIDADSACQ